MTDPSLLDRVAERCGIVSRYHDIWSRPQRVTPETQRALLAAMGVRADDDEALRAELRRRDEAAWRAMLPPVLVVRGPVQSIEVPVGVPPERAGQPLVARLITEDGARAEQRVDLGGARPVDVHGRVYLRARLRFDDPGPGYHEVELRLAGEPGSDGDEPLARMRLIVAPGRCHTPEGLANDRRVWGPAVQLYALRSGRDWGVGDFTDLSALVGRCGELGAGIVGLNPLHSLFAANPAHASPYSPSTRSLLQWLYLDVEAVAGFDGCEEARRLVASPEFQARLVGLRQGELVDYPGVAAAKREVLELAYGEFRRFHLDAGDPQGDAFREFVAAAGEFLEAWGTFEALEERFRPEGAWGWPAWPEAYRHRGAEAVRRFADERRERIEFFQWLQWNCERQLGQAGRRCLEQGMKVGLYQDLAVGVDRAGFETWWYRDLYAVEAGIGAPPDDFNLRGQNWGLPPWIPERLREAAYRPFIDCLRANMRHAGALRIDHVMGLMRAFWVPPGRPATEGAYVRYPFEDLLGILALESVRNRCLVIGEDLGTVPDEVRAALRPLGVLSYRLFWFARGEGGSFEQPAAYPRQSLVAATTHDLPTLAAWWRGADIALRAELGLFPEERQREEQLAERSRDRARLLFALRHEDLLPEGIDADLARFPDELTPELMVAVHRYLARSPAMVLTFQLEDVLAQLEQVNLPGTTDEHPNWRRRLAADIETLGRDPRILELAAALRRERGGGTVPPAPPGGGTGPRIPRATYRLQLHGGFRFTQATRIVPYLDRLGISHVYASPLLQARPASLHGYDIIDHGSLNAEIGTAAEFQQLVDALRRREMGLVLDMVPNHMGVGSDNVWWMSVLEHGRASPYASFFDIDWRPHKLELRGKVLLPVLEDHYGRVLERGLLRLEFLSDEGAFRVAYHEHRFPVDPASYPQVLSLGFERLQARVGADDPRVAELQTVIAALGHLPARDPERDEGQAEGEDPGATAERRLRDAAVYRRRLARLAEQSEEVATFVAANVAHVNGTTGDPASFDRLDALLGVQAYRLAFWRTAADEINYRRFFDINELAGLRMEEPAAFEATHRLVLDLLRDWRAEGLRIDHPDGLHDPAGYYRRLQDELGGPAPDGGPPRWIVAEKILAPGERMPDDHAVHGTTGYDFANLVIGLFVDPEGRRALDRTYHRFIGRRIDWEALVHDSKTLILESALSSELTMLTDALERLSESDRRTRDFTRERLRDALAEVIAWFPVYRTYVGEGGVAEADRLHVDRAVARAREGERARETSVYDFIRDVLLLEGIEGMDEAARRRVIAFAGKFQQVTGPVMAKGVEDTAFYIDNRLLAMNEVGSEPQRFEVSVPMFHRDNADRAASRPHAMLAGSTHDSKRSEDARARIAVLSEIPGDWEAAVRRWSAMNRGRKVRVDGRPAPSRNDEYALYQTLLGVWPADGPPDDVVLTALRDRVRGQALKGVREAKIHGSWIEPDEAYEAATTAFVDALLDRPDGSFVADLDAFARRTAALGALGGLSQVLLKLTSPGVPDLYQGNELIAPAMVDPDNRRPVDFEARRRALETLERRAAGADAGPAELAGELMRGCTDGRAKLFVTWRTLGLRRRREALFREGGYRALAVSGERASHVVAFAREAGDEVVVVVAPRLVAGLCDPLEDRWPVGEAAWGDTSVELPQAAAGRRLRDVFTGAEQDTSPSRLSAVLSSFPVALLEAEQ